MKNTYWATASAAEEESDADIYDEEDVVALRSHRSLRDMKRLSAEVQYDNIFADRYDTAFIIFLTE